MGFIPAKCTQCGADIDVDDSMDAGICEYCGTAFVTEKVINNYIACDTDKHNGSIDNYLHLAQNALWADNGLEAYDYAKKALEIDGMSSEAWLIKMKATALIADSVKSPAEEIKTYGINALSYAEDDDVPRITDQVYRFYLYTAMCFLHEATMKIMDLDDIWAAKSSEMYDPIKLMTDDSAVREEIDKIVHDAWMLKVGVPAEDIRENPDYRDTVKSLVRDFQFYCSYDALRVSLYDCKIYDHEQADREYVLKLLKEGLTEEDIKELDELAKVAEASEANDVPAQKTGCYIATAVYGSYDSPEVLVLRQFRDNVLSKYLCGRYFINLYYAISPFLVKYIGKNKTFLCIGRLVLDKFVSRIKHFG